MGKFDSRNSNKMRRRKSQAEKKARTQRLAAEVKSSRSKTSKSKKK
jgi:hypothetical protein